MMSIFEYQSEEGKPQSRYPTRSIARKNYLIVSW